MSKFKDNQTRLTELELWNPIVGDETKEFLERSAPSESREMLEESASSILSKGVSPKAAVGTQTGLVVGYVQSGKTMSFETVAALARDNDFQIIIVVAGVTTNLLDQSTDRLASDLGLNDTKKRRRWIQLPNPRDTDEPLHLLKNCLLYTSPSPRDKRQSRMPSSA